MSPYQSQPVRSTTGCSPLKDEQVYGTFYLRVLDGTPMDDPWTRNYTSSPKMVKKMAKTYPLNDFREQIFGEQTPEQEQTSGNQEEHFDDGYKEHGWSWSRSAAFLKRFGFTAVKFDEKWSKGERDGRVEDFDDQGILENLYYPEVIESMKRLTGAKEVFITNSIVRRGDQGSTCTQTQAQPQGLQAQAHEKTAASSRDMKRNDSVVAENAGNSDRHADVAATDKKAADTNPEKNKPRTDYKALDDTTPTHLGSTDNAKPSPTPHLDYTPLGARRSIRRWRPDIYNAAMKAGVIPAEDRICDSVHVNAQDHKSNAIIAEKYNADGKLGPRYAAYSVWRPLRTVTRDPLAMAPRWDFPESSGIEFLPYEVRVLASPAMYGDFLRELEALSVHEEDADKEMKSARTNMVAESTDSQADGPRWYYISQQKPDEAIVLKFFDSAALGGGGPLDEAAGVPHSSADIGEAAYGGPRESIEVRCIVFW